MKHRSILSALALLLAACTSYGPGTVARDQFDYHLALSRSRKEQLLLNMVQLRYLDTPVFLEVGQIVAGYNYEGNLAIGGSAVIDGDESITLGGSGKYVERPTITYTPIRGARFVELLLTPIPPASILFLIESGWPVELILPTTVESVNGIHNYTTTGFGHTHGDEAFLEFVELMDILQKEDRIALHNQKYDDEIVRTVVRFRDVEKGGAESVRSDRLRELLGLEPGCADFEVVYGAPDDDPHTVNVLSRSMLQILYELSSGVEVPDKHDDSGWTLPVMEQEGRVPPIKIRSGSSRPSSAFAAVSYQGHWFWIDHADLGSKQLLSFLLMIFNYVETETTRSVPIVTIPTG